MRGYERRETGASAQTFVVVCPPADTLTPFLCWRGEDQSTAVGCRARAARRLRRRNDDVTYKFTVRGPHY